MIIKQGDSQTLSNVNNANQQLRRCFEGEIHPHIFNFDTPVAKTINLIGAKIGTHPDLMVVHFKDVGATLSKCIEITGGWAIDLTTTGIDLANQTSGVLTGVAALNGFDYLVWAFLDDDLQFLGIGVTQKPLTTFSAIGGGSVAKGGTATFTTGVFANIFAIGARVIVRNNVGTAPQHEWNWGTITAIPSVSSITVQMDNNAAYGSAITGITGGFIEQMDTFKPHINASPETLYATHYVLMGEFWTAVAGGNIQYAYRVDEPHRILKGLKQVVNVTAPFTGIVDFGRYLPLWADELDINLSIEDTLAGSAFIVQSNATNIYSTSTQVANVSISSGLTAVQCQSYAQLNAVIGSATAASMNVTGYWVWKGMRE